MLNAKVSLGDFYLRAQEKYTAKRGKFFFKVKRERERETCMLEKHRDFMKHGIFWI